MPDQNYLRPTYSTQYRTHRYPGFSSAEGGGAASGSQNSAANALTSAAQGGARQPQFGRSPRQATPSLGARTQDFEDRREPDGYTPGARQSSYDAIGVDTPSAGLADIGLDLGLDFDLGETFGDIAVGAAGLVGGIAGGLAGAMTGPIAPVAVPALSRLGSYGFSSVAESMLGRTDDQPDSVGDSAAAPSLDRGLPGALGGYPGRDLSSPAAGAMAARSMSGPTDTYSTVGGLATGTSSSPGGRGTRSTAALGGYPGRDLSSPAAGAMAARSMSGPTDTYSTVGGEASGGSSSQDGNFSFDDGSFGEGTGTGSNDGCYITNAVMNNVAGEAEGTQELNTMRSFRDNVLNRTPNGQAAVAAYYATAPGVVANLERQANKKDVYADLYNQYLRPAVEAINSGDMQKAMNLYMEMLFEAGSSCQHDQNVTVPTSQTVT